MIPVRLWVNFWKSPLFGAGTRCLVCVSNRSAPPYKLPDGGRGPAARYARETVGDGRGVISAPLHRRSPEVNGAPPEGGNDGRWLFHTAATAWGSSLSIRASPPRGLRNACARH